MSTVRIVLNKTIVNGKRSISIAIRNRYSRAQYNTGFWVKSLGDIDKRQKELIEYKTIKAKQYIFENPHLSAKNVVNYLNGDRNYESTIFEYWKSLINDYEKSGNHGNKSIYQTALNSLKGFTKDIQFSEVDLTFLEQYRSRLKSTGLSINAMGVYLRTFRAVWNKADKDFNFNISPFKHFKIQNEKKQPRNLNSEEIRSIYNSTGEARDVFMLSFFLCGINLVDLFYNDWRIHKGRFIVKRKKVSRSDAFISIKIEPEMKFNFKPLKDHTKYRTYLRRINRKLNDLGKELEIEEGLTTYVARYSWANIAHHELGFDKNIIAQCMGHIQSQTIDSYLIGIDYSKRDEINRKVIDAIVERK
jgi:integrase/recombinase XerD